MTLTTTTAEPPENRPLASAREYCRNALLDLAQGDPDIVCLDSDMGGLDAVFAARLGGRYLDVGIAEANMLSCAAGLAKGGCRPVAHTMASFAATRACEQLKLDIAHHSLPVVIVASHGGLSAGHYGPTHFCIEDLAILRSFPNLGVVVPCDAREAELALRAAVRHDGPVYLRLGRNPTPILTDDATFELGRARILRHGTEVAIIASGPHALMASIAAADRLTSQVSVLVVNMATIKPLDVDTIVMAAQQTGALVTVEEHTVLGGLGGAVCEVVAQRHPCKVVCLGIPDQIPDRVGDEASLLMELGISPQGVHDAIFRVLRPTATPGMHGL